MATPVTPVAENGSVYNAGNPLHVTTGEIDLALGLISGQTEGTKFGYVTGIDAADAGCDIFDYASDTITGTPVLPFPTTAAAIYVASSSASDTNVDVTIEYISSTGAAATVSVNLNGQTPVDTGVTGFGVNWAYESGATAALGHITVARTAAWTAGVPNDRATTLAFIELGLGQSHQAAFTVPLGYTIRIKTIKATISRLSGAAGGAQISFRARLFGKTWITYRYIHMTTSQVYDEEGPAGLVFPERTDIVMRMEDVSDTDTNCTAKFSYDLIAD